MSAQTLPRNTFLSILTDYSTTARAVTRSMGIVTTLMYVIAGFLNDPLWSYFTIAMTLFFASLVTIEILNREDVRREVFPLFTISLFVAFAVMSLPSIVWIGMLINKPITGFYEYAIAPLLYILFTAFLWQPKVHRGFFALAGTGFSSLIVAQWIENFSIHIYFWPPLYDNEWLIVGAYAVIHYVAGWLISGRPSMQITDTAKAAWRFIAKSIEFITRPHDEVILLSGVITLVGYVLYFTGHGSDAMVKVVMLVNLYFAILMGRVVGIFPGTFYDQLQSGSIALLISMGGTALAHVYFTDQYTIVERMFWFYTLPLIWWIWMMSSWKDGNDVDEIAGWFNSIFGSIAAVVGVAAIMVFPEYIETLAIPWHVFTPAVVATLIVAAFAHYWAGWLINDRPSTPAPEIIRFITGWEDRMYFLGRAVLVLYTINAYYNSDNFWGITFTVIEGFLAGFLIYEEAVTRWGKPLSKVMKFIVMFLVYTLVFALLWIVNPNTMILDIGCMLILAAFVGAYWHVKHMWAESHAPKFGSAFFGLVVGAIIVATNPFDTMIDTVQNAVAFIVCLVIGGLVHYFAMPLFTVFLDD